MENLSQDILFTHIYMGRISEEEVTCVSRPSRDDPWDETCTLQSVERIDKTHTEVVCACKHMTDYSLFIEILVHSNLALLWGNFFRGQWTNRNFFSWVVAQQWVFLGVFCLLYWVASKVDLRFKHTERYMTERYQFESLHQRFANIKNGKMHNAVYHRQSLAFKAN